MKTGRQPQADDVNRVAAKIWSDANPGGVPWQVAKTDPAISRWYQRAAKLALGVLDDRSAKRVKSGKVIKKRRPLFLRWR